jgi:ribonuclease R
MTKKRFLHDPHAEREAEKYENPIPSREFILAVIESQGKLVKFNDLCELLSLEHDEDQESLKRRLRAMERDGQLLRNRKGGYGLIQKMNLIPGRVVAQRQGFGFVRPDEGGEEIYLSSSDMRRVFHGDRVLVQLTRVEKRGRREGVVAEIIDRAVAEIAGRLVNENGIIFVIPDHKRIQTPILITPESASKAKVGDLVVVKITHYPEHRMDNAIGEIIDVLGAHRDPGLEIDVALSNYGIPNQVSEGVENEIKGISPIVSEEAKAGRKDLRHLPLVTIDGEDARDFDDAIYTEPLKNGGWRLYVAIADVSYYVKPNTALDMQARERGNSVYFPNRVVPMLPEILSNGLCSLNPNEDRLCMVCEWTITADGELNRYRFYEAVMRSQARMTYTNVAKILEQKNATLRKQYKAIVPHLENLHQLYFALRKQRIARGAIDFESEETRVIFGKNKKIERIVPVERNVAHKIVEECMLAANVGAARFCIKDKLPILYRVHENPSEEKLTDLRHFLAELKITLRGGKKPKAENFREVIEKIQDRPDTHLIQTVMLRTMMQASYNPENIGHFGLAYRAYTHFTSPIRRYPDLLLHRVIRHQLAIEQNKAKNKTLYTHEEMITLGEQCSMTERRADEATRDVMYWLKCEYMLDKVGETFEGIISGVTGFGIFVQLKDIYIEGLVHISDLSEDYYQFDSKSHKLVGRLTGKIYQLGMPLKVKVDRVDLDERKIDFSLG